MSRPSLRHRVLSVFRLAVHPVHRTAASDGFWRDVRSQHPRFTTAVAADARITAARRGDRVPGPSKVELAVVAVHLAFVTDSFFGQCCYRAKARCQALRIPLVPRYLNHLAVRNGQVAIGDPVVVEAGVFIPHGQVCIDGITRIGRGAVLSPFISIGLRSGDHQGPTIGRRASIGTGARILGPWRIGDGASVGANAVVTRDIPAGTTAVGVPARVLG